MNLRRMGCVLCTAMFACTTVESESGTSFGTAPSSVGDSAGPSTDATDGTGGSGSEGSDEHGTEGATTGTTGGSDPSGDASATLPTTGDASSGPDDDDGMNDDGGQPGTGMYAHCLAPEQCAGGSINVCITINDGRTGFCTNSTCTNPAVDCDPSPGGTAEPICYPITINDMPAQSCALDCAGGKTCPGGMQCFALEGGLSVCA
jgi:hypothetical protein